MKSSALLGLPFPSLGMSCLAIRRQVQCASQLRKDSVCACRWNPWMFRADLERRGTACNGEQLPLFSRQIPPLLLAREACLRAILVIAASEQVGARGIATCFQPSVPASGSFRQFYEDTDTHEMACFASGLFAVCPRFLFGVSFSFIEVSMVSKKARAAAACAGLGGCWPQVCSAVLV